MKYFSFLLLAYKYGMGTFWQTFGVKRFPIFPLLFPVTRWGVLLALITLQNPLVQFRAAM